MALLFLLSHQPSLPAPALFPGQDKVFHGVAYAILGSLYYWALPERAGNRLLLASGLAALYGLTDEFHQSFVPGRSAEIWDLAADATGGFLGATAAQWLSGFAQRRRLMGS
jgi:VanZ family protein